MPINMVTSSDLKFYVMFSQSKLRKNVYDPKLLSSTSINHSVSSRSKEENFFNGKISLSFFLILSAESNFVILHFTFLFLLVSKYKSRDYI